MSRVAALASAVLVLLTALAASAAPSERPQGPPPEDPPGPSCEQAFIERVYRATKPSVVRITRPDGGLGTGFVFHTRRHVATALHVVDLGRDVRVELPSGKVLRAEVVAWDAQHDLALLELEDDADAPPLVPRRSVPIGALLLAIGNPYGTLARLSPDLEGLLNFSVSQGIVSAKGEAYVQTDAMLSPGNSGGPMLTCDGQVVAVADRLLEGRIGFGVPIVHVEKLTEGIRRRTFMGAWSARDAAIGLVFHADASSYVGPYLGGSVAFADRLSLTVRLGAAFAGKNDTAEPIVDRSVRRLFGELVVGWRILLFPYAFPTYVTLGGGVLGTIDRGSETRLDAVSDPSGTPRLAASTAAIRGGGIMPLGQAVLHLSSLELSYGFALDVLHPEYSTHRVLVGLAF